MSESRRLVVKAANRDDAEKEWLFVRDMPPDENGLINEWYQVSREDFEEKALPQMIAFAEGRGLPEGYVPETFLFLWDGDRIVGQFRIRHYLLHWEKFPGERIRNGRAAPDAGSCPRNRTGG